MLPQLQRHTLVFFLLAGVAGAWSTGCGEVRTRPALSATAPSLRNGEMVRTSHNLADPNAPFSMPSPRLALRPQILDVNGVPPCDPAALSIFESRAEVNGSRRSLRFSLVNNGRACRIAGFPSITLLRADGSLIGGVRIRKVSADSLQASMTAPSTVRSSGSVDPSLDAPSPPVLVPASASADFELGWTSGPRCEAVTRIAFAAPGSLTSMQVSRPITVCEKEVLITAVAPSDPR